MLLLMSEEAAQIDTRQERALGLAPLMLSVLVSVTEPQNGLDWKGPERFSSNTPAVGRDVFHYPRLLRDPSGLAINTSRDRTATGSLSNMCQCLTGLTEKNFLLISDPKLLSVSFKPYPLSCDSMLL